MAELHHNTPEQVAEYLRLALKAATDAQLPEALMPIGFQKAIEMIASKTILAGSSVAVPAGAAERAIMGSRPH